MPSLDQTDGSDGGSATAIVRARQARSERSTWVQETGFAVDERAASVDSKSKRSREIKRSNAPEGRCLRVSLQRAEEVHVTGPTERRRTQRDDRLEIEIDGPILGVNRRERVHDQRIRLTIRQ